MENNQVNYIRKEFFIKRFLGGRLQHTSGLYENRLFIFGGESIKEKQLNDFYMLNLGKNKKNFFNMNR